MDISIVKGKSLLFPFVQRGSEFGPVWHLEGESMGSKNKKGGIEATNSWLARAMLT